MLKIKDNIDLKELEKFGFEQGKLIDYEEAQLLLDYITNLQQDLDKANDIIQKDRQFYKCRMDEYVDLKKENETLKEQNNDLRKIYRNTYKRLFENGNDELARYFQAQIDECPTFYVEHIIDYAKEYKIYKSRCEKANKLLQRHNEDTGDIYYKYNNRFVKSELKERLSEVLSGDENE